MIKRFWRKRAGAHAIIQESTHNGQFSDISPKSIFPNKKHSNKKKLCFFIWTFQLIKVFSVERKTFVIPLRADDGCQIYNLLTVMAAKMIDGKFHVTGFIYYKSKTRSSRTYTGSAAKWNKGNVQLVLSATFLYVWNTWSCSRDRQNQLTATRRM